MVFYTFTSGEMFLSRSVSFPVSESFSEYLRVHEICCQIIYGSVWVRPLAHFGTNHPLCRSIMNWLPVSRGSNVLWCSHGSDRFWFFPSYSQPSHHCSVIRLNERIELALVRVRNFLAVWVRGLVVWSIGPYTLCWIMSPSACSHSF